MQQRTSGRFTRIIAVRGEYEAVAISSGLTGIANAKLTWLGMRDSTSCNRMERSRHNNVLIRSGEARLVGWSRSMLYSGFNILPRSVFWSAYFNGRSDNTDVMSLFNRSNHENK